MGFAELAIVTNFITAALPPCKDILAQATEVHGKANRTIVGTQALPSGLILFFGDSLNPQETYALVFISDESVQMTGGLFTLKGKCLDARKDPVSYWTAVIPKT